MCNDYVAIQRNSVADCDGYWFRLGFCTEIEQENENDDGQKEERWFKGGWLIQVCCLILRLKQATHGHLSLCAAGII
jgi:hypothetical protein